jgi:hypothetical protein
MASWRVFYYRPHRKTDDGERRDQAIVESESEPTPEQVAEVTGDRVLRLDGAEQIAEEP